MAMVHHFLDLTQERLVTFYALVIENKGLICYNMGTRENQ